MTALSDKLLKINLEINSILKSSDKELDENFGKLLDEKNSLIEELKTLKEPLKKEETWEKLQELENENLNLIKSRKDLIFQEINGIKTHVKAISSYKFKQDQEPRLFDDSL
ncbi:MAG: hypothetical protein A2Y25_09950 [Candidatus Melainabacteria bacterium GWF2_37_15]|nr:MAG: hypothetical protein A2Y25_09950 [Candidatus Melainabacteria bacterium GWF2_37_15]